MNTFIVNAKAIYAYFINKSFSYFIVKIQLCIYTIKLSSVNTYTVLSVL